MPLRLLFELKRPMSFSRFRVGLLVPLNRLFNPFSARRLIRDHYAGFTDLGGQPPQ